MSQPDFAVLTVHCELSDANLDSSHKNEKVISVKKQKSEMQLDNQEDFATMDVDGLHAVAADCEQPNVSSENASYSMDIAAASVQQSKFEPCRRIKVFTPPKRFYRTFWRLAAVRIVALASTRTIHDHEMLT
jgi:hypothetical protein